MTLNQLGALVSHLLTQIAVLINPISAILALVGITTKEKTPYLVQNEVLAIGENLSSGVYGLAVLAAGISALQDSVDALGSPQQSTSPVILPATAPSTFLADSDQEIADACWIQPPTGYPAGFDQPMTAVMRSTQYQNYFNLPYGYGIFQIAVVNYAALSFSVPDFSFATFDPTDILPGETLLANLTRQNPSWLVSYFWPPQTQVALSPTDGTNITWITTIDEAGWRLYYEALYPSGANDIAPIWPGIDLVTLGATVSLVDALLIAGPLAGVIVVITSVPTPISYYPFGSIRSYVRAGAVLFTDDNGDSEFPQPLGPESQVILARSMAVAASCSFRVPSGVVGTVTPFTIP